MIVLTSQFWGRRSQSWGRKPVLVAALALGTTMMAMFGLVAVLGNTYREDVEPVVFDQVVADCATLPADDLWRELKPLSVNLGEVDLDAMVAARRQTIRSNPDGRFEIYRVGDAWAARNIHAAMLDAMRLCLPL